MALRLSYMVGQ